MIYFMEEYPVSSVERVDDSVILRGKSDRNWVYISSDRKTMRRIVAKLSGEDRCFAAIEDWMFSELVRDRVLAWKLSAVKMVLPPAVTFTPSSSDIIRPLSLADVDHIYESSRYKSLTSPAYIEERIRKGPHAGVYASGKLVAWIMTHDDGSIGVMNVLEEYRRKRYAYDLTVYLIRQIRSMGKIPYVHVEENNAKGLELAHKVGFREERVLHWFELKEE